MLNSDPAAESKRRGSSAGKRQETGCLIIAGVVLVVDCDEIRVYAGDWQYAPRDPGASADSIPSGIDITA